MTSLRARLMVGLVVLAAMGLAVAGVVTYSSLRSFLYDRVDQQLAVAGQPVATSFGRPGFGLASGGAERSLPAGTWGELRGSDGEVVVSGSLDRSDRRPPGFDHDRPTKRPFTVGNWRVRIDPAVDPRTGEGYTLAVAIPLDDVQDTLGRLVRVELFVALAVLGGLAGMAWWVVKLGLRPLEAMGATAGAIAAGDLARRVEPADPKTEVGRLGASLNAMLHQIEGAFAERTESEHRLRRFVADAAHELRTPLTSIRGYAELFRRGASERPEDLARSMQRIEAEAARMGVLVDDLLLLARLDQGRPLELVPVDLGAVVGEVVADARVANPGRSIALEVPGERLRVDGDEGRLRQAVQNLVSNAVAHTPAAASVRVTVGRAGAEALVEVAHDGSGIPAGDLPHLFERFYRNDRTRARAQGGGTGLGQSIEAAVAEAHG
ncbi:MAG: sensor histidine kinase, partial [Acidimicrobiia bacterium]